MNAPAGVAWASSRGAFPAPFPARPAAPPLRTDVLVLSAGVALGASVAALAASGKTSGNGCIARSGKLDRARSRLYRGQISHENMRWKALAEIYIMHSFAQLCNLNFSSKFAKTKSLNFAKFSKINNFV